MTKHKYWQVDNLYAIGTVLVVLGHSHSSDWSTFAATPLNTAIQFIYLFHMPLFFFLAGFLFMNSGSLERDGFGKWLGEKALKLMTPYGMLSVIALVPKYYFEYSGFSGFTVGYLLEAVFKPRIGVWGHFWFLPVLLLTYMLFGAWKALIKRGLARKDIVAAVIVSSVIYFLPVTTQWLGLSDLREALEFFAFGIGAHAFACKRVNGMISRSRMILCAILAISVSVYLAHTAHGRAVKLMIALLMIAACWQIAELMGESRVATWISRHNFTIYIYSWPFQAAMMVLCVKLRLWWLPTSLLMFATGIAAPCAIAVAYEKADKMHNRFFDLMLGVK